MKEEGFFRSSKDKRRVREGRVGFMKRREGTSADGYGGFVIRIGRGCVAYIRISYQS